jgi:hypothetical protein
MGKMARLNASSIGIGTPLDGDEDLFGRWALRTVGAVDKHKPQGFRFIGTAQERPYHSFI